MSTKIEAQQQNVGAIFSDIYELEIPPFQRPYDWEMEHARALLLDLVDALDNQETNGGLYFLGSLVLVKTPDKPPSKVIDGQQRLTTLTILLSVLRDLTKDEKIQFRRREYVYQEPNTDRGTKERYRLLLRERDREFFAKFIQHPGATNNLPDTSKLEGSPKLIAENARFFRSQLDGMPEERKDALIAFIVQHCYMVVVSVSTAEAAKRIFTVLNTRGRDLTATDILKAELLDRAERDKEPALAERWEEVERAVGREIMVELFGHIRMMYERDKPRLALEYGFKKHVPLFSGEPQGFISEVLEPLADAYLLLTDSRRVERDFGTEAAKAVRSLERIDNKDWIPPALLRIWKSKPADGAEAGRFLVALERVAYLLFVTRAGVNDRITRFAEVMNEFDPRPEAKGTDAGTTLTAAEQYAFLQVLAGPIYLSPRVCKPVLQRLDEAISTGGANYDVLISIEHVLPQKIENGSEWATWFPEEPQRRAWTHRLANLVLLTRRVNTRASNWSFETKKREYFSSKDGSTPFVLTQGVLRTDRWTAQHLAERQRELLLKLCEVWGLDSVDLDGQLEDLIKEGGGRQLTDSKIMEATRTDIVETLSRREGVKLNRKGALCWSDDETLRAVCALSKRHAGRAVPYWYGYSNEWREFLAKARTSFLVLGCLDRKRAYAIPVAEIEKILHGLERTADRHWHISLRENQFGGLDLTPRKGGVLISLDKFELRFH
jgi:hypothetical protein